jgi:GT2 family glycosyltransferase
MVKDNKNSRNQQPTFSIALVNYKTLEVTSICLNLLQQAVDTSQVPILVVDNNSADASLAYLKTLDWIHLIERKTDAPEVGYMAHGRALDMVLERVTTDYLLLLHSDTLIYDKTIISILINRLQANSQVAAVGCLEQVHRPAYATIWRKLVRGIKYYGRCAKVALGIKTREPRLFYEIYLKSFCTLWNVNTVKKHGLSFAMVDKIPGYEMQDQLRALGYTFDCIPPSEMFQYLDHIEAGTVSHVNGLGKNHKRVKNYQAILQKINVQSAKNAPK